MQGLSVAAQPMIGASHVSGTGTGTGVFNAVYCITPTVFAAWSEANLTGPMTGVSFPAGAWIYGQINSFTLTSGDVRAYRV